MVFSTTLPPPVVTVSSFKDIADAKTILDLFEQDGIQLQAELLHARRIVVRLPTVSLIYQATSLRPATGTGLLHA
jgi:hypothetical protein